MITLASTNDYEDIQKLGLKYDKNFMNLYDLESFKSDFRRIIIFKHNKIINGFCLIEETIDESSILLVYVDKPYRRKKIASQMIDYYFNNLNSKIKRVLLEVSDVNKAALSLYKKEGFTIISRRNNYYRDGSDAIIMERSIKYE